MNIPSGLIRYGSTGKNVRDLQRELNSAGFNCGAVDGIFGSHTRAAVVAFQRAKHIGVDGIVGRQTWGSLGGDRFEDSSGPRGTSGPRSTPGAGGINVTPAMRRLAQAGYNAAMSMGGTHSEGLCATGVSRALANAFGMSVGGNGNTIGNYLPKDKFRQINIPLSEALKIPGLILSWQHTPTAAGSIYGHTAITSGDGVSSNSDFHEFNTLASSAGRTGLRIYMPTF